MPPVEEVSWDNVNEAFRTGAFMKEDDARLLAYLRVLCSVQVLSNSNQTLANNRCITINTLLTSRFMVRVDQATTFYTRIVIVLAVIGVLAAGAQVLRC